MNKLDIKDWSEALVRDFYSYWRDNSSVLVHGFKIFYSAPRFRPRLMIISYQPGGTVANFDAEDAPSWRSGNFSITGNAYLDNEHRMSRRMRDLFSFSGGRSLLEESVILPVLFFRAPNSRDWKKMLPPVERKEAEKRSFDTVKEIVYKVQPQSLLVLGFDTRACLGKLLPIKHQKYIKLGKRRLISFDVIDGIDTMTILHPTGARVSKEGWSRIKKEFLIFTDH